MNEDFDEFIKAHSGLRQPLEIGHTLIQPDDDPLMDPQMCEAMDVEMVGSGGIEEAAEISFFGGVADFEQEVVKPSFLQHNETLFDDDITTALLNTINNKSQNLSLILENPANDSVVAEDGSRSF